MVTKLTAARQLVLYAARCFDAGARADMERACQAVRLETAMEIALNAVRIHAGRLLTESMWNAISGTPADDRR